MTWGVALVLMTGCGSQDSATVRREAEPSPAPAAQAESLWRFEATRWIWQNNLGTHIVTNVGWQSADLDGVIDMTRIESGSKVTYVYRKFTDSHESLYASETLLSEIETTADAKRWIEHAEPALKLAKIREWKNTTEMAEVDRRLTKSLKDQVKDCPQAQARLRIQLPQKFSSLGNVLVRPRYLFYGDRWLGAIESSLEVEWEGLRPVGIVTSFERRSLHQLTAHSEWPRFPQIYLVAGIALAPRLVDARAVADVGAIYGVGQLCDQATEETIKTVQGFRGIDINHVILPEEHKP